ncbi:23S rRNA (cytidine1920-2'-O)/16S rRNA (cytidine1409-2'-O)-methyltransferase [Marinospirillum celere]|uniref:23S rRNA (Cytidine1920-2'-O)/16S rRNA (Cytidine1409-2'-O)-methyltransferase n=1 Tax=Marinospirillum celere TaxID=1122252 RepID=A0A1I1E350_9GAMM|nr:TlyA family RNA methyltransferase [Marinospirillum celere]SFB81524.1 23S rRNA (cytidine1920-2'-O)/16S rRNA (cytidine1409-2'-O)-methyltransferase [Marinospirillum celere]
MQRLDLLLVTQQLASTRTQAQQMLEKGRVRLFKNGDWQSVSKPGLKLPEDSRLEVTPSDEDRYVARGALKLEALLLKTGLDISGWQVLDIGQSTGGFTDCVLQAGASQVVGLDVGQQQLHPSLKDDQRITCLEKVNARYLEPTHLSDQGFPALYDLLVMDVSFISQTLILPQLPVLLKEGGWLMSLVKPQFEVGKEKVGKKGIVRDPSLYKEVEQKICSQLEELGLEVKTWITSPIKGGDGNQEFLVAAQKRS